MSAGVFGPGDSDDIVFPDFNDVSNYCALEAANVSLNSSNESDLSVLYINIVSLPCNMTKLLNFLTKLDKKPDIICLSETKITEKCNTHFNPYINGYSFEKIKSKTHFGGVGVFIRNSLICTERTDLNCSEKGLFEMIWFDVSCNVNNAQKSTIGIIYRHGGEATIPTFTSYMDTRINKLT